MAYVYLIESTDNDKRYKIGMTRSSDVSKRLKQLQTGNSSKLTIKEVYETDHPFKLEKMLHNRFKSKQTIGEWFELNDDDIRDFKGVCDHLTVIIASLKDNPFF